MNEAGVAQLLASAHTAGLAVRAVGHGLHALGQRIDGIEHQAADFRWLPIIARQLGWMCLPPARR